MEAEEKRSTVERLKQEKIEEERHKREAQLDLENVLKQLQYYESIPQDKKTLDNIDTQAFNEREKGRLNALIMKCDINIQAKQSNIERLSK